MMASTNEMEQEESPVYRDNLGFQSASTGTEKVLDKTRMMFQPTVVVFTMLLYLFCFLNFIAEELLL